MNRIIELTMHDGTRYSVGSDVIAIDEVMDNGEMAMVTNYVVSYRMVHVFGSIEDATLNRSPLEMNCKMCNDDGTHCSRCDTREQLHRLLTPRGMQCTLDQIEQIMADAYVEYAKDHPMRITLLCEVNRRLLAAKVQRWNSQPHFEAAVASAAMIAEAERLLLDVFEATGWSAEAP